MHYELFIPGQHADIDSALQSVGFEGYGEGAESSLQDFPATGQRGHHICWRCGGRSIKYNCSPDRWQPAESFGELKAARYQIAISADSPPRPHELAKSSAFRGPRLRLGDGQYWQMPSVPRFDRSFVVRDGDFQAVIDPKLAWAHAESRRWHELIQQDDTRHDATDAVRTVYRVLCLNYRLTPEVVNTLGLLTLSTVQDCLLAMIGLGGGDSGNSDAATEGGGRV